MKYLPTLLGLAAVATALTGTENESGLEERSPPGTNPSDIMMFLCNDIPEVCTNMCYGAFCLDVSQGLKWDKPDKKTKAARRRAAGCAPNPNRCSTKKGYKKGYNCDEYPFASTVSNGGKSARVNRCVPTGENSKQGGTISKFYSGSYCNNKACTFTVGFENSGNVKYCDAYTDKKGKCNNDGNEELGSGGSQRRSFIQGRAVASGNSTMGSPAPKYKTSSGSEIVVPAGAQIGQKVVRVKAVDHKLWTEQAESHEYEVNIVNGYDTQYDYMHENLVLEEETIVEHLG